jgi:hypothetical protein
MIELTKVKSVTEAEAIEQGFVKHPFAYDVEQLPEVQNKILAQDGISAVVFVQIPKSANFVPWIKTDL